MFDSLFVVNFWIGIEASVLIRYKIKLRMRVVGKEIKHPNDATMVLIFLMGEATNVFC